MATSVPAPMAMPISARVRAGASLIPSPTMVTLPERFNLRTTASLPSGKTPAITSSTPACLPMARAVRSLSPVSITTRMPMFCNSRIARGLSSRITSATAMMPSRTPSRLKNSGVFPSSAKASARLSSASGTAAFWPMNRRLPPANLRPARFPVKPLPGRAQKSSTSSAASRSSSALRKIAFARGCSLFFSNAQATRSSSSSSTPSAGRMSVTFGSPPVMVPVLSSTTISVLPVSSRETAVLNRIPFFAPMPLPTMIATGVASPKAQGQLMTSTEIPLAKANPMSFPASSQMTVVITATVITVGTNTPETRSATLAMGALVAAASLTIRMI